MPASPVLRVQLIPLLFLLLCLPLNSQTTPYSAAANGKTGKGTNSPNLTPALPAPQELLKVTINASRISVTRDGSYGVYADLENLSQDVVRIRPQETMLVVQPEVAQPSACVRLEPGIFPAQPTAADLMKSDGLLIQPNEHYKVFWNLTSPDKPPGTSAPEKPTEAKCSGSSWIREYLGFVPGEYAFTVEGIVYAQNSSGATVAHSYTETTTLHVGISQISTATAAFIGALLAYFVVALQPGQEFAKFQQTKIATAQADANKAWWTTSRGWLTYLGKIARNSLAAGLLGSALTIVASRLSDTQFPIKVSVNDFWGALTIGFVSYFLGSQLITAITKRFFPADTGKNAGTSPDTVIPG